MSGCCYECDQDAYADGCAAGKGITLLAIERAINERVERIGKEAAGIETALEIIAELRGEQ